MQPHSSWTNIDSLKNKTKQNKNKNKTKQNKKQGKTRKNKQTQKQTKNKQNKTKNKKLNVNIRHHAHLEYVDDTYSTANF